MRCDRAQRALSASLHEPVPAPADVRRHVETCAVCSRYAARLHRLHQVARLEEAPPVPDLTAAIMTKVRADRPVVTMPVDHRNRPHRGPVGRRVIAGGLAAGLVVGFVIGNGGLIPHRATSSQALASEIPRRLVRAAVALRGYHAVFDVTERNWSTRVPVRTFVASVSFRAPEDFRVVVRDRSRYPSAAWPRNDMELVSNGRAWQERGPNPCPPDELPACHPDTISRTVVGRGPFDEGTAMPTDVIVPMTVLAGLDRVRVLGPDTVDGRSAEAVSLSFEDAAPLLSYLQFLGSWRPFSPQDRVVLWLDRSTWFPLRYEVFPEPGRERATWASQMGIVGDRPDRPSFVATARSISTAIPPASQFRVRRYGAVDDGFRRTSSSVRAITLPASSGMHPVAAGRFVRTLARPYDERLAGYASGLAWVTVAQVRGWTPRRLFGVGDFADRVVIPGGGVGYYEPATSTEARRVALHTPRAEYLLASNLPEARLLRLAGMLHVRGRTPPTSWFVRQWGGGVVRDGLPISRAAARMPFEVLVPSSVPSGYEPSPAQAAVTPRLHALTVVYRRPAAELDGIGIRLYESSASALPPPQSVSEEAVGVRGVTGRWSPDSHLLEWVQGGVSYSLTSPGFDLSTLLRIANSLRPVAPR